MSPETAKIIPDAKEAGEHRSSIATRDLTRWLSKVGLTYHSPHKFRHGHAVYALKNAKDVSVLKAVSQNLMHENLTITDGIYGILSETDVRKQISELGQKLDDFQIENIASLMLSLKRIETLLLKQKA